MHHHARVLQERVQVAPVGWGWKKAHEGVRGEQDEQQESGAHQAHDAEHARHHLLRQVAAEKGDAERPHRKHQDPQNHRAFVPAPHSGDPVLQRQRGIGVGGDVGDGEIVRDEGRGEAGEGDRDEYELAAGRGPGRRHPDRLAARRADESKNALSEREAQGEGEGELSELWNHLGPAPPSRRVCVAFSLMDWACLIASAAAGGM